MGYYSEYKIDLADESFEDAFLLALAEVGNEGYAKYLESGYASTFGMSDAKWYDFARDMDAVAQALPQVSFETEQLGEDGEGERRYYAAGVLTGKQKRGWVEA